jgi:hypothetical protein
MYGSGWNKRISTPSNNRDVEEEFMRSASNPEEGKL